MNPSQNFTFEKTSRGFPELLDVNRYRYQKSFRVMNNGATTWLCKDSRNTMVKRKAYAVLLDNQIQVKRSIYMVILSLRPRTLKIEK